MTVYEIEIEPKGFFSSVLTHNAVWGAVATALFWIYGEEDLRKFVELCGDGKIIFSSPMPKVNGKRFFFKPVLKPSMLRDEDFGFKSVSEFRRFVKKLKKLRFLEEELFLDACQGKIATEEDLAKRLVKSGERLENPAFFSELGIPHAKIDRIRLSTTEPGGNFYYEKAIFYSFGESIFILLSLDESAGDWKHKIESAFLLLQDWGIGGNTSIGYGNFELKSFSRYERFEKYLPTSGRNCGSYVILSPAVVCKGIDYKNSRYDLSTFVGANSQFSPVSFLWKPKVLYLKEGSILKVEKLPIGKVWSLSDGSKSIYQNGIGFPVCLNEGK